MATNSRKLKSLLSNLVPSSLQNGEIKLILEANSPEYYLMRAREETKKAGATAIQNAIFLLALVLEDRLNGSPTNLPQSRSRGGR